MPGFFFVYLSNKLKCRQLYNQICYTRVDQMVGQNSTTLTGTNVEFVRSQTPKARTLKYYALSQIQNRS